MKENIFYIEQSFEEKSDKTEKKSYSVDDIINSNHRIIIVLAEPGAGKTKLTEEVKNKTGAELVKAKFFIGSSKIINASFVIIDGFDEVAKSSQADNNKIIEKASDLSSDKIIITSRSGEWAESDTQSIIDCFNVTPLIVYLLPFDRHKQQAFYNKYTDKRDFDNFISELTKVGLENIISNPQLLQIMIDAYDADKTFKSKTKAFEDCIKKAVTEVNKGYNRRERPQEERLIALSEQIFACYMLSGIAGIHTNETNADKEYPFYKNLAENDDINFRYLFDTKLFKPSDIPETHEPIHRIIAEFCAVKYINRKISDPQSKTTIRTILSLIAPNNTVRDDLRGLIGWLATLSDNEELSKKCIALDAYAVIAYGDASQLSADLKIDLLYALEKLSQDDPYFQRHDKWRDIILVNFFNEALLKKIADILLSEDMNEPLKDFLWKLLIHSKDDYSSIYNVMYQFIINDKIEFYTRTFAIKCVNWTDKTTQSVFDILIQSNTKDSLALMARLLGDKRYKYISSDDLLKYAEKLTLFFPNSRPYGRGNHFERKSNITYFLNTLEPNDVVLLLDELTKNLKCTCKKEYGCKCNVSKSKLISFLIDVFLKTQNNYNVHQLYLWLKDLNFELSGNPSNSHLVKILNDAPRLKRKIIGLLFQNTNDYETAKKLVQKLHRPMHAGLRLYEQDYFVLVRWAYKIKSYHIWASLYSTHDKYNKTEWVNKLRHLLRYHSKNNIKCLEISAKIERKYQQDCKKEKNEPWNIADKRRCRKYHRKNNKILTENKKVYDQKKELITNGESYWWLKEFAIEFVYGQNNMYYIAFVPDDIKIKTLSNCLPFILKLIEKQNSWDNLNLDCLYVIYAGCFLHFEEYGRLDDIDHRFLKTLKRNNFSTANLDSARTGIFQQAINQALFQNDSDRINFLKEIFEPIFEKYLDTEPKDDSYIENNLLHEPEFENIISELSQKWLEKYIHLPFETLRIIFNLASKNQNLDNLKNITIQKYQYFDNLPLPMTNYQNSLYEFWSIRAFLLLDNDATDAKKWLKKSDDNIFKLHHIIDHNIPKWVIFSSQKVFDILDAFIDQWQPVFLPNSWGTSSPRTETAYRHLRDITSKISLDKPDEVIKYCNLMLKDVRYQPYHDILKTHYAPAMRKKMLQDFQAPEANKIKEFFDNQQIISVEHLRAFIMDKLVEYQIWLKGASTTPLDVFYQNGECVHEETASKRVAEYLERECNVLNLSLKIETRMNNDNRCDITTNKNMNGQEILLVIEAKGQWNKELFTALEEQLDKKYSIHPNAQEQGIYLVYWFGKDKKVAGRKQHTFQSPNELKIKIESEIKEELKSKIDVFVLDLER